LAASFVRVGRKFADFAGILQRILPESGIFAERTNRLVQKRLRKVERPQASPNTGIIIRPNYDDNGANDEQALMECYASLDPKWDFCLEAGLKIHLQKEENDPLDYLLRVRKVFKGHSQALEELLSGNQSRISGKF